MKKRMKKVTALMLCAAMAASFAGGSAEKSNNSADSKDASAASKEGKEDLLTIDVFSRNAN